MKKANLSILFIFISIALPINAQNYVVPPTSASRAHVPVISDEKMEQCVKLYNEALWLSDKIEGIQVDRFNKESVDSYNQLVNKHSTMINKFNLECAGKQSRSACEAAQKLNKEKGLPYQKC